jgi:hypothetical protein
MISTSAAASVKSIWPVASVSKATGDLAAAPAALTVSRPTDRLAIFVADTPVSSICWIGAGLLRVGESGTPVIGDDLVDDALDGGRVDAGGSGRVHIDRHTGQANSPRAEGAALPFAHDGDRHDHARAYVGSHRKSLLIGPPTVMQSGAQVGVGAT